MKIDKMLLMSGKDIPLLQSNILIHHPTIEEIINMFLSEDNFFIGYEFLFFSKDRLTQTDFQYLENVNNFEILLTLIKNFNKSPMKKQIECLRNLLLLLFKNYEVIFETEKIILNKDDYVFFIQEQEFEQLKELVRVMFPIKQNNAIDYNPQGGRAREIAEKLRKAHAKITKQHKDEGISLLERYISILSIGLQIPIFEFKQYTIYQLLSSFERYEKKEVYDVHLKAQLAGATGMKDVDHWMM